MLDVIVIGAGQAGLASAYALRSAGFEFQVLEAAADPGGSWPDYYDSLKLFSPAKYSALPGMVFPGDPDRYPVRDEVVQYLRSYAQYFDFPITHRTRVRHVEAIDGGFLVADEQGKHWQSRALIVATGSFAQPNRPRFEGDELFAGHMLHAADYRNMADIEAGPVAVVGAGNSALQIAYELAAEREVVLVSRKPPVFMKQRPLGLDIHFWLRLSGFDRAPLGAWFGWKLSEAVLDHGRYEAAIRDGRISWKPMFDRLSRAKMHWGDSAKSVDTLLLATGYRSEPSFLQGLRRMQSEGWSASGSQRGGIAHSISGLYFVGMPWQRSHASATLRGVGADAAYVVKHMSRSLQ